MSQNLHGDMEITYTMGRKLKHAVRSTLMDIGLFLGGVAVMFFGTFAGILVGFLMILLSILLGVVVLNSIVRTERLLISSDTLTYAKRGMFGGETREYEAYSIEEIITRNLSLFPLHTALFPRPERGHT